MPASAETDSLIDSLAAQAGALLLQSGRLLSTAESCTGGWVAQALTAVPGSSAWFERGFITYSNLAKCEMLDVKISTLSNFGAVSEETVREMAQGALRHSPTQISLAISGVAGPAGGTEQKPVGLVCLAWASREGPLVSRSVHLCGDRTAVRRQAVVIAVQGLIEFIVGRTSSATSSTHD